MSKILLKNITKKYDNSTENILENFNLEIEAGEFLILVGPSGCGKSTILRLISGFEQINSGNIYIDTKDVGKLPPKERGIAMVFQNYALYPHMTVYENIAFPLKIAKIDKKIIEQKVVETAKKLEIFELLDRKPSEISGGQKQRVAIARAMVRNPKIFLFDEPLSNLDAKLKVDMRIKILKLHEELKKTSNPTMVYVTHDQIEAMTMGDRICVVNNGKIMQIDTPEMIYTNPANKFVAEFIGNPSMNFFEGEIVYKNGRLQFYSKEIVLDVDDKVELERYVDKKVILGIRPEDIDIQEGEKTITGEVELVENTGNEYYVHITVGDNVVIVRTQKKVEKNRNYGIIFKKEKIYFFDKDTEKTIK